MTAPMTTLPLLSPSATTQVPLGGPIISPEVLAGGGDVSLSMSLRPVPAQTVQLIRSNRFIEMRELLDDNTAVRHHFEEVNGVLGYQVLPMSSRPRVREVTSLSSWISCYLTYVAVRTSDPATRKRLTYTILLIRKALRHGGQHWLEYDRLFRQQASLDPNLSWSTIHPGLQATTILSQCVGQGTFCTVCQECDHSSSQCAMMQLQQPILRSTSATLRIRTKARRICSSWNEGSCTYPGTCTYRHICSRCFQPSHMARDCQASKRAWAGPGGNRPPPTSTSHPST